MKQLILVRHAQTKIEPDVPAETWKITENGRLLTTQLTQQLHPYAPTTISSSPYPKAQQTAQIINHALGLPITLHQNLREQDRQGMPFLSQTEFRQKISDLLQYPTELHYGTETGQIAQQRFTQAIKSIMATTDCPIVVSHGTIMALFLSYHNPTLNPVTLWQQMTQPAAFVLSYPNLQLQTQFLM